MTEEEEMKRKETFDKIQKKMEKVKSPMHSPTRELECDNGSNEDE